MDASRKMRAPRLSGLQRPRPKKTDENTCTQEQEKFDEIGTGSGCMKAADIGAHVNTCRKMRAPRARGLQKPQPLKFRDSLCEPRSTPHHGNELWNNGQCARSAIRLDTDSCIFARIKDQIQQDVIFNLKLETKLKEQKYVNFNKDRREKSRNNKMGVLPKCNMIVHQDREEETCTGRDLNEDKRHRPDQPLPKSDLLIQIKGKGRGSRRIVRENLQIQIPNNFCKKWKEMKAAKQRKDHQHAFEQCRDNSPSSCSRKSHGSLKSVDSGFDDTDDVLWENEDDFRREMEDFLINSPFVCRGRQLDSVCEEQVSQCHPKNQDNAGISQFDSGNVSKNLSKLMDVHQTYTCTCSDNGSSSLSSTATKAERRLDVSNSESECQARSNTQKSKSRLSSTSSTGNGPEILHEGHQSNTEEDRTNHGTRISEDFSSRDTSIPRDGSSSVVDRLDCISGPNSDSELNNQSKDNVQSTSTQVYNDCMSGPNSDSVLHNQSKGNVQSTATQVYMDCMSGPNSDSELNNQSKDNVQSTSTQVYNDCMSGPNSDSVMHNQSKDNVQCTSTQVYCGEKASDDKNACAEPATESTNEKECVKGDDGNQSTETATNNQMQVADLVEQLTRLQVKKGDELVLQKAIQELNNLLSKTKENLLEDTTSTRNSLPTSSFDCSETTVCVDASKCNETCVATDASKYNQNSVCTDGNKCNVADASKCRQSVGVADGIVCGKPNLTENQPSKKFRKEPNICCVERQPIGPGCSASLVTKAELGMPQGMYTARGRRHMFRKYQEAMHDFRFCFDDMIEQDRYYLRDELLLLSQVPASRKRPQEWAYLTKVLPEVCLMDVEEHFEYDPKKGLTLNNKIFNNVTNRNVFLQLFYDSNDEDPTTQLPLKSSKDGLANRRPWDASKPDNTYKQKRSDLRNRNNGKMPWSPVMSQGNTPSSAPRTSFSCISGNHCNRIRPEQHQQSETSGAFGWCPKGNRNVGTRIDFEQKETTSTSDSPKCFSFTGNSHIPHIKSEEDFPPLQGKNDSPSVKSPAKTNPPFLFQDKKPKRFLPFSLQENNDLCPANTTPKMVSPFSLSRLEPGASGGTPFIFRRRTEPASFF